MSVLDIRISSPWIGKSLAVLIGIGGLLPGQTSVLGQSLPHSGAEKYLALPLTRRAGGKVLNRYGVPFREEILPLTTGGAAQVHVGVSAKRIFFLGMTDTDKLPGLKQLAGPRFRSLSSLIRPATPCRGWDDPRNHAVRFFVGDHLGQIRLNYADGSSQVFPLILGESVWWGRAFFDYNEPFPADANQRRALASALRLYPPAPVRDGNYVAVINPKPVPIRSITVENSPEKKGTLLIAGITIETTSASRIAGATALTPVAFPRAFAKFIRTKALLPRGTDERRTRHRLQHLRLAIYTSNADFKGRVVKSVPPGYTGPDVSFKGNIFAEILANVFRWNVQDIANKIGKNGMYHTSTKGAASWGGYDGFGFYRNNVGRYYGASFSRDMGRSLQELTSLGYTSAASRCADYCFHMARVFTTDPSLKFRGIFLPPHWGELVNQPGGQPFENDGQGLTMLFLYDLWEQLPNRSQWLEAHWPDIKAAGDWILWQFADPKISGAANGLLHTTGEAANGSGYSVFADSICMNALRAFAQMADSIDKTRSAAQWCQRADKMQRAITQHYIVTVPKYGRVWTLAYANWPDKTTVLGPLISQADYQGFAPQDGIRAWRAVNKATYQRLIDTYKPFGFYGQAMGYGQGFITEAALLLDRMRDATTMLNWAAKQIYDPKFGFYIVPEGCEIDSTGRFWYSIGDLGNGVQEGEIVKALRLVIGIDDTQPERPQFFPRLPYGWKEIAVARYPVVFKRAGKIATTHLRYALKRQRHTMTLAMSAGKDVGPVAMRLGPFRNRPMASDVRVNGAIPAGGVVEHSGDSWWVGFTANVGPVGAANDGRAAARPRTMAHHGLAKIKTEQPEP